jgi:hypothetical protein
MTELDKSKFPLFKNLEQSGIYQTVLKFPKEMSEAIATENWNEVDSLLFKYLESGGLLYNELIKFHPFDHTEHIIAIRKSTTDEDGIWHDDGSRHIAFTWSFNDDPHLTGGELLFRKKKSNETKTIEPPPKETLVIFLTGHYHYEHKVNKVTNGTRKTIAGWCTSNII